MKAKGVLLLAGGAALFGCDPNQISLFKLLSPDGASALSWPIADKQNTGADPTRLRTLSGNVGRAQYHLSAENAAYLFEGDLAAGISSGQVFTLPRYDERLATLTEGGFNWMTFAVSNPSTWHSFRVYDSGVCSVVLGWTRAILPPTVPAFASVVADEVDKVFASCAQNPNLRFERVSAATLTPIFKATPNGSVLSHDADRIRFRATYRAISIGGCAPVNLDVQFDMGFERDAAGNINGVVENVGADVQGLCIAEGGIVSQVMTTVSAQAPAAIAAAARDRFVLDPRLFGIPASSIPRCSTDADCATAYPGTGHRCRTNAGTQECWVQANVDRVNVRPEGVEFVLFEDEADPQRSLLPSDSVLGSALCGPDRLGGVLPARSAAGIVSAFSVPTHLTVAGICGS